MPMVCTVSFRLSTGIGDALCVLGIAERRQWWNHALLPLLCVGGLPLSKNGSQVWRNFSCAGGAAEKLPSIGPWARKICYGLDEGSVEPARVLAENRPSTS